MLRAIKVRIYPNKEQEVYIAKLLGSCRFVYNYLLNYKINIYKTESRTAGLSELGKIITALKKTDEFSWLRDSHSNPQNQSLIDLEVAFSKFFKKESGFPNFKSRRENIQSCRFPKKAFSGINGNRLKIVKALNNILFKSSRYDEIFLNKNQDKIRSGTLSRTKSGKYFLSILIDRCPKRTLIESNNVIGIDIGIKDFVVTSDGERFENIKIIRNNEKKLKKLQRQHSKKQKGSNNKEKARLKLARFHEKLTNRKNHYLHQVSNKLLNENQVVVFETLNIKGMMANHCLAKAVCELSAFHFKKIVKCKADWYGRDFIEIDQYFPSSRLCECCGFKNDNLTLNDRTWVCPSCGVEHDRDLNAASNIRNEGVRLLREKYKNDGLKLSKLGLSSPDVKSAEKAMKLSVKQKKNVIHSSE